MKSYLLICLVFVLTLPFARAQLHQFHQLSKDEGLVAGTNNNYIFQDSRNNVWISSISGLYRFDGHRIIPYHQGTAEGDLIAEIASNSDFGEDRQGRIWFGLRKAYVYYDYTTDGFRDFVVHHEGKQISDHYDWAWLDVRDDNFYFGAGNFLYYVNTSQPKQYKLLDSVRVNFKAKMLPLKNGGVRLLKILPDSDVVEFADYKNGRRIKDSGPIPLPESEKLNDISSLSETKLLVATDGGLRILNTIDSTWRQFQNPDENKDFNAIELERLGDTLFVGSKSSGIHVFNLNEEKYEGELTIVGSGGITAFKPSLVRLHIGNNRLLWVSTSGQGVFYTDLKASKVSYLPGTDGGGEAVIDLIEDQTGNLLVLYADHYTVSNDGQTRSYPIPINKKAEFDEPTFLYVDRVGRLFIGTYNRLYVASEIGGKMEPVHLVPGVPYRLGYGYNQMNQLANGDFLFCVNDSVPIKVNESLTKSEDYLPGLNRPRKILFGGKDDGIVLTYEDTLHVFNPSTRAKDTFFTNQPLVVDAVFDPLRQTYWLATLNGLYFLKQESGKWQLKRVEGIGDGNIMGIEMNGEKEIWMSGANGIQHYDISMNTVRTLLLSDGIQGLEFRLDASLAAKDGTLYFGGSNGITWFDPGDIKPTVALPETKIVRCLVNGTERPESQFSALTYKDNNLTIDLANGDLSDPSACNYYYTLVGAARQDTLLADDAQISFTNLSPQKYELEVWSENSDGVIGEKTIKLPFTIHPPWYNTWWAYLCYALFVFSLVRAYFLLRLGREREKAARARAEAEAAETTTSILRLQMNPHFIFNSLNSIDDYILDEAPMKAHDYLVMFAELMRDILNRSTQPLTRLDQEIEMLEKYIEAERMRLGEGLRYAVELTGDIDTVSTYIPTMILQPFVENAIWHGIGNRDSGGLITLRFGLNEANSSLVATVEDDGRGRRNAKKRTKKHASKALNITRQRLDLLNRKLTTALPTSPAPAAAPQEAYYEIQDLTREDGSPSGTKVVLYLPLIYPEEHESRSY